MECVARDSFCCLQDTLAGPALLEKKAGMRVAKVMGMRILNVMLGGFIFGFLLLQIAAGKQGPANPTQLARAASVTTLDPEMASPDSRYLTQIQGKSLALIRVFDGARKTTVLPGQFIRSWWSPDSLRLTVIVSGQAGDGSEDMLILPVE